MWQSRVEIEGYSVLYFDCIAAFEASYRWTSVKGGAHMHFLDLLDIHASMKRDKPSPWRKFSDTALQTQKCDQNTRHDFYMGLPHMFCVLWKSTQDGVSCSLRCIPHTDELLRGKNPYSLKKHQTLTHVEGCTHCCSVVNRDITLYCSSTNQGLPKVLSCWCSWASI